MLGLNRALVKGSFILVLAFGLYNFLHFLFQFFMARMLSVPDYGVLASLFAIIYIAAILVESIQTIIAKYSANEENNGKLKNLLRKSFRKAGFLAAIMFAVYLLIAIPLSFFLHIPYLLVSLTGLIIVFAFFTPVSRGVMQGKKRFLSLGWNLFFEAAGKLVFGAGLVMLGFKVYGAIIGATIGGVIALVLSFVQLKDIFTSKEEKTKSAGIYDYAKPTFFIMAIIIIFYSLDVIIAKMIFTDDAAAGNYAIASILGKIIFWGTLPISKAMFPISAENSEKKESRTGTLANSLILVIIGVIFVLMIFYFAPGFIVMFFSNKEYADISTAISVLFPVGLAFAFISIANLILLYKLSIGRTKNYGVLFFFVLIEIALLVYFSKDVVQFSWAFVAASVALLIGTIFLPNQKIDAPPRTKVRDLNGARFLDASKFL